MQLKGTAETVREGVGGEGEGLNVISCSITQVCQGRRGSRVCRGSVIRNISRFAAANQTEMSQGSFGYFVQARSHRPDLVISE